MKKQKKNEVNVKALKKIKVYVREDFKLPGP